MARPGASKDDWNKKIKSDARALKILARRRRLMRRPDVRPHDAVRTFADTSYDGAAGVAVRDLTIY